jgi:excisionase family DNA binding protein
MKYYTAQEAANRLKVCVTTVYRLVKRGELTATKENGRLLIPVSEVEQLSQANTFEQQTNSVRTVNEQFEQVFEPEIVPNLETISPASAQIKVRYSLRFLKWLLLMNRTINRALEAMIVFLESDGKAHE